MVAKRVIIRIIVGGQVTVQAQISQSVEDYLEAIYELIEIKGYARTVDISSSLNIQPPSVTEMVQKLDKRGLLVYERYRGVKLTKKGEILAKSIKRRHETLVKFLEILGVDSEIAKKDACRIEHYVDPKTMKCLAKFVDFVLYAPQEEGKRWLKHFNHFIETGEHGHDE